VVLAGTALAALLFVLRKDRSLAISGLLGARLGTAWAVSAVLIGRYVARPGFGVVDEVEGVGLPAVEAGLGRAAAGAGSAAGRQLPWLTVVAFGAVVLAVVVALAATGGRL
jgi:hypothetical protein